MNIRSYKKFVKDLPVGATFYLNTINASVAIIEHTRELIQTGIIEPDNALLIQCVTPQAQELFKSGTSIFPQMWYMKRKEN